VLTDQSEQFRISILLEKLLQPLCLD